MEERSTTIWYDLKEKFKLSLSEYAVLDLIYRMSPHGSKTVRSPFPCTTSRASLAEYLGMSKAGVFRIVERLLKKGVLKKGKGDSGRSYLILGDEWEEAMFPYREKEK